MAGIEEATHREIVHALRNSGAVFALLFGSRARGDDRPGADVDVAASRVAGPPAPFEVDLPAGVDLLVLNGAPLELAGRAAVEGALLFDDDPSERVRCVATTRKVYFDELPRLRRSHQELAAAVLRGR